MRHFALLAAWTIAVAALPAQSGAALPAPLEILIVGDVGPTGFALAHDPLTGEALHRPGSGVTAGRGTASDPYVIESPEVARIHLLQTSAHVVIRNARVDRQSSLPDGTAILLEQAQNVRIEGGEIVGSPALGLDGAVAVLVQGATLRAADHHDDVVEVLHSRQVSIRESHLSALRGPGVYARGFDGLELARNTLDGIETLAYYLEEGRGAAVRDHTIASGPSRAVFVDNEGSIYERNAVALAVSGSPAVLALGERTFTLRDSNVTGPGHGFWAIDAAGVRVERLGVALTTGGDGLYCRNSTDVSVAGSALASAWGNGVDAVDCPRLDIVGSTLDRLFAAEVHGARLEGNLVQGYAWWAGDDVSVRDNRIEDVYESVMYGPRLVVEGNVFSRAEYGSTFAVWNGSRIVGNEFRDTARTALQLYESSDSRLDGNRFVNTTREILLDGSTRLTVDNHTLQRGMAINAEGPEHLRHTFGPNNTVHGRPILLLHDLSDTTIGGDYGQLFLVNSTHIVLDAPAIHNVSRGITLAATTNVTIRGGSIVDSSTGIDSTDDVGLRVEGTLLARNGLAMWAWNADGLTLQGARFLQNRHAGLLDLRGPSSTLAVRDVEVHETKLLGLWAQDGRLDVERSSFLANGHDPNFTYRNYGFPGDPAVLTSSTNVTIGSSRFVENDLGLWAMLGGDARRNHWGCPDGPNATGCDALATNRPTLTAPWCANDVYAESTCDERGGALASSALASAPAAAAPRFERTPAGAPSCLTAALPRACAALAQLRAPTAEPGGDGLLGISIRAAP